jgi:hypothetical protein
LVNDKPAAARTLRSQGVQALEFWNHGANAADEETSETVRFLRQHVLALPIHQDLSARQLNHMVSRVSSLNLQAA